MKIIKALSLFFFLAILLIAIVFYKERVFYYDSAFQFFKILFFDKFNIEAGRYGTVIVQLPVIIAMKLGFSLKSLSVIFSASFVVLYALVFLLVTFGFKNDFAGLAIVMSLAMGTSLGFFHTVTEIHQGIVYSLLFLGVLYVPVYKNFPVIKNDLLTALAIAIGMLAFFSHPSSFFLLAFVLGYFIVDQKAWNQPKIYFLFFLLMTGVVLKLIFTDSGSYEGQLFPKPELFLNLTPKFWTLYGFKFFFKRIFGIYFFLVVSSIILIINYICLKHWLKLGYFLLASGLFFIITLVTYHEGNADIAMERIFLPLNVFVAVPFCKDFIFRDKHLKIAKVIYLSLLLIVGIGFILNGATRYKKRTQYLEKLIGEAKIQGASKLIASADQLDMNIVEVPWALATETILLSSLNNDSSVTIYLTDTKDDIAKINTQDPGVLLIANFWLYWNAKDLNKRYFILKNEPYHVLKEKVK